MSSSSTAMFRPSINLPEVIRHHLPEDLTNDQVPRVPVASRSGFPHLLFDPTSLSAFKYELTCQGEYKRDLIHGSIKYSRMPPVGEFCWLLINKDAQRFLGRITRVAQFQETRVIVVVEHVRSPAIVSVVVPYEFYCGATEETEGLWDRVVRWAYQRPREIKRLPDSNRPISGMCATRYAHSQT